ncbi:MAG: rane dipeptidase [Solirubrobacteraceae bacterium]|nr:rane dipeptidase [Solirubrobacteraceae bacterium]
MIVDLHAHYPMHLDSAVRGNLWRLLRTRRGQLRIRDYFRGIAVHIASQFFNYRRPFAGPRIDLPKLNAGGVGVAYSVLYSFFDEADCAPPEPGEYAAELVRLAGAVAASLVDDAVVARNPAELTAATGKLALVHCVEGGFHLGRTPDDVRAAVDTLADAGVAYITLAHLCFRGIATNANALPFLGDAQYAAVCRQRADVGLTKAGHAAIEQMLERKVLIDVSHMSEQALADTWAKLDREDPHRRVPVLATHGAFRFGEQHYNLSRDTVERIVERDGVIGLIFAQHQIWDGLEDRHPQWLYRLREHRAGTFAKLERHIEAIAEVSHDYRHVGIGSDFDGFIKPTLKGLRDMASVARLEEWLVERYEDDAELICSENALRPLRTYWGGAP